MILKICGIKEIDVLECCEKNNVDFFGLIFYKNSSRFISNDKAKKLINFSQYKKIKPVGVFYNENIETVISFINNLNLKTVQLHGSENDEYIKIIKNIPGLKVIKAISVKNIEDIKLINNYKSNDYYLFDYKPEKDDLPGGNAKSFEWSILSNLKIKKPWFLSGGINQTNINKIKNFVNPDGIDLSSGVEEIPGIKSIKKINKLIKTYNEI